MDAAMQAGFPNDQLFPKRGMPINFTVNGGARIARGEAGEAAIVTMNGQPANINTPLEPNSDITIEPSTAGDNAVYTIGQLPEYHESVISFVINGQNVVCPKFVEVNGSLEPDSYEIQEEIPSRHGIFIPLHRLQNLWTWKLTPTVKFWSITGKRGWRPWYTKISPLTGHR